MIHKLVLIAISISFLAVTIIAKDKKETPIFQKPADRVLLAGEKFVRYYDKALNIVCYVHLHKKNIQCFDIDRERLKLMAGIKEDNKGKPIPQLELNGYESDY